MNSFIEDDIKGKTINSLLKMDKFRGRIDAKCVECIYDPLGSGSLRFQVENCTSFDCPLHNIRATTIQRKLD
jgi:hypothetical protein